MLFGERRRMSSLKAFQYLSLTSNSISIAAYFLSTRAFCTLRSPGFNLTHHEGMGLRGAHQPSGHKVESRKSMGSFQKVSGQTVASARLG
jgi:hypothetical protein